MSKLILQHSQQSETTFASLLRELQHIWDEVGESEAEMGKVLLELEQECLTVYRRKVEQASHARARLHQSIAEKEGELSSLFAILGERPAFPETQRKPISLKEQLAAITPQLEELRVKKERRAKQFIEVRTQIQKITGEISGSSIGEAELFSSSGEEDLSFRRLDEHHTQLQTLIKEKSERLQKVLECVNVLHELCSVLGMDFVETINEVHPSLNESRASEQPKSISNETLDRLSNTIQALVKRKKQSMEMLQGLTLSLKELWKLMDVPPSEQKKFYQINDLGLQISASGGLGIEVIDKFKSEVQRLEHLKASKMKELVLKKRMELEGICRDAHMEADANTAPDKMSAMIDSGMVEASELLVNLEDQIVLARKEVLGRKEILDKVERWLTTCEEEKWLEDYNMDDRRFTSGRGAHLNLKRAEKARMMVMKLPALVDALILRTRSWEEEKGTCFLFDGMRLLTMLDEYTSSQREREEEKRRVRVQRRLQEQLMVEKEILYGSKASPTKLASTLSFRKGMVGGGRQTMPTSPRCVATRPSTPDSTPRSNGNHKLNPFSNHNRRGSGGWSCTTGPLNFVSIQQNHHVKDDTVSTISAGGSSDSPSPMGLADTHS